MTIRRYSSSAILATGMVFLIFLVMQALVKNDLPIGDPNTREFLKPTVRPDTTPEPVRRRPPPPVRPVIERQPHTILTIPDNQNPGRPAPPTYTPHVGPITGPVGIPGQGEGQLNFDSEMIPHFKVAPLYPQREMMRGIEGDVLVQFTVTRDGTVEGCKVIEDPSTGGLGRASCMAALKFEYMPRTINGEGVDVVGVQHMFTFKLDDKK